LWDWEDITNDWFIYTVDWLQGATSHSVQLLANRDNSHIIIRSPSFRRERGVFTSRQRRVIKEIFSPAHVAAYRADSLGQLERTFGPTRPVVRLGMWILPGHPPDSAYWGETNLSPATQHLIATFDQFLGIPKLTGSILSN
jgi:hypothetical protein